MRCSRLTMLMCTVTGMPSSTAAAQNGSSAVETLSPPDGQFEITTPLAPRAFALRSPSIAESIPSDGICAMPMSRVGSGAQNSSNRKLLYASTPARTKSSSSSPRKWLIVRCGGNRTSASTPSMSMSSTRAAPL